jgi:hypothetical protein
MGRRLAEALARLSALVVELQELLDRASLEACEADADLCMGVRYVIRRLQAEVVERFQWVAEPPYCFACAGTPEGARSFLTQYEAVGVERHHRVSVSIYRRFEAQLRQLADQLLIAAEVTWGGAPGHQPCSGDLCVMEQCP